MPTLTIGNQSVTVDDSFLKLSPEQQNATVEEIAKSLSAEKPVAQPDIPDPMKASLGDFFDVPKPPRVVTAEMPYSEQMRNVGRVINNGVRLAANGLTFGQADKAAGAMDALTGRAASYDEGARAQRAETQALRDAAPIPAAIAEGAGGLAGGVGLIKSGVTLAGRLGPALLPRVLGYGAEGAAYGAAHGAGNTYSGNPMDYVDAAKKGAAVGAAVGAGLPVLGTAAGAAYRAGSAFLGPRIADVGRGASALLRTAAQADEPGLQRLAQMGPDAMLVDAGPSMLGLGQGAATGTGPGKSQLVNALTERNAQTGPRLARVLDDNLGPSPVPSRIEANLSGNRALVSQEYEPVLQNAQAVDTTALANTLDAAAVNLRGPAQRAVRQVREMLDIPGNPGNLDPHPRALLSTRQAIDGMIATETNPQVVQQLTVARQAVDAELARAVPGIKQVDAQIEELSRQSGGLQRGSQIFDTGKTAVRPSELSAELTQGANPQGTMIGPSAMPLRVRQGARAEIDRVVGTKVNDLTALERELATPQDWNNQKAAIVFGDGPTARVAEALINNRLFRDSYQKIVQNSQTAQRTVSSQAMEGAAGGNVPTDTTMTGLGLKALNLVAKAISGASSASTKEDIARVLASQGPAVQRVAQALLDSARTAAANSRTLSGMVSSPYLIGASTPAAGRK